MKYYIISMDLGAPSKRVYFFRFEKRSNYYWMNPYKMSAYTFASKKEALKILTKCKNKQIEFTGNSNFKRMNFIEKSKIVSEDELLIIEQIADYRVLD